MPRVIGRVEPFFLLLAIASSIAIFILLAPVVALFIVADPGVAARVWIRDPALASEARESLARTLAAATLSSTLLLALGVPLAYLLARRDFPGRTLVESLIDVPLMIPHAVAGIMVLVAYSGRGGVFSWAPRALGIEVMDSFWGVVAAMVFVSAPIMVDTVKVGIREVDPMYEHVARSLGASPWRTFYTVTLPMVRQSIVAGFILSWARGVSEVGAILIVAYYPKTINVLVIEWFNTYGLQYALALSLVLVAISLAFFTALKLVARR